jgi:hypothetical protein
MKSRRARSAVLELFVVIFGILIAFAVDAAWDRRSERIEERETLLALDSNFRNSIELLEERWLIIHEKAVEATNALIWTLQGGSEWPGPLEDLTLDDYINRFVIPVTDRPADPSTWMVMVPDSLLGLTLITPTYDPTLSSLDALLASGRLNLISNRELSDALAAFPSLLADASDEERMSRDHVMNELRPRLGLATSMLRAELIASNWAEFGHDSLPQTILENVRPLRASPELGNVLATRSNIAAGALGGLEDVRDAMAAILEMIEAELR